jgi:hypothetical protein
MVFDPFNNPEFQKIARIIALTKGTEGWRSLDVFATHALVEAFQAVCRCDEISCIIDPDDKKTTAEQETPLPRKQAS